MASSGADTERRQRTALNGLIVACSDTRRIYKDAIWLLASAEDRKELISLARRRAEFVRDMAACVRSLGGAPRRRGSIIGWTRRAMRAAWRLVAGGPHERDVYRDCARAEARASVLYVQALRAPWPLAIDRLLRAQSVEIDGDRARLGGIRLQNVL